MGWLIERFSEFDENIAIIHEGKEYSYKQLLGEIDKINTIIINGKIKSGVVVAILSDYSFESIALLLALFQNKNIIVPITTKIKSEINDRVVEAYIDKTIRVVDNTYQVSNIDLEKNHPMIIELQNTNNSGLVLFSSGSTGQPKAMIHNFDNLVNHYKSKKIRSMNMLVFLLFDHIGGLNTLLNILSMGSSMIIPENRGADEVCKLIQDYKIKILPSSPTFLNLILIAQSYEKYDLSSLRMITYGTEAMPESLLIRLRNIFPKIKFLQTFGTSETGIANTISKSSNSTFLKIDDPNLNYKIVNNELWLKSKTQIIGYLNASMESFTDDGWFKTGDLVELTNDGYIKIIGRNKEIINVGGEKVLPIEVESIILEMSEVEDCLVYGESNIITGQTVVVDIVLSIIVENRKAKKNIRKYCKEKLDGYKIPTKVNIVDKTNFGDRFKKIRRK